MALVDGGWIWLGERYPTFEQCWAELAPQVPQGLTLAELARRFRSWFADFPPEGVEGQLANLTEDADGHAAARLTREHHRQILHSLWADDPAPAVPAGQVPALIAVAVRRRTSDEGADLAGSLLPASDDLAYVGAAPRPARPAARPDGRRPAGAGRARRGGAA